MGLDFRFIQIFWGGCGCVEGWWWWRLWLWISGFVVGGGGAWLMVVELGLREYERG